MNSISKFVCFVAFFLSLISCDMLESSDKIPSVPLLYFSFEGNNESSGIEPFKIYGSQTMSYSSGIKDSSLNLTGSSYFRKPIVVETKGHFIPQQQNAFAVIVWVNVAEGDNEVYGIIGNKGINTENERGWIVSTTNEGAWQLEVSDGFEHQVYRATPVRQRINDGKWHQLGFMMDKNEKVARTYFDGKLVGVMSLTGIQGFDADYNLFIGCDPASLDYTMDTFNGELDEIGVWSQRLSDDQFKQDFVSIKKERMSAPPVAGDSIRVMTWNIWNGGRQQGKRVGLDIIAQCIEDNKADIVSLQEGFGSGEYLADKLDYYFYRRSHNLCLLSRFPLGRNLNMYKPINLGCIEVLLNEDNKVIMCPLWLSFKPNIKGLLMNEAANNDTILKIEDSSRGSEMTFVLSELNQLNNDLESASIVVAGDFNSGSHLDWTEENRSNKYNKVIPFPSTTKIENKGFIDAYREVWPSPMIVSGNTYSPIFKEGYNDRIDFIYYKGNHIKAINASVVDSTAALFPSDHAAVLVTFQLQ